MAIIKVGPPLAGIRGTIGGVIYSENKSGCYARIWSRGANPKSPKQSGERSFLSSMPALWNALNDPQRAAWRAFADDPAQELTNPLGEDYFASGYNWFVKCNIRLLRVARATIQAVPTQARPTAPTIIEFRVTPPGTEVDQCVGGGPLASTWTLNFEADKAFDDNLATAWMTLAPNTTGWLRYVFATPGPIRKYRLWYPAAAPDLRAKDWTFEGLDNGGWIVLHTVTDWVFEDDAWATFYPKNLVDYEDYRINITANNGHGTNVFIREMEMYKGVEDSSMIHYTEDDFEDAPDYDLVLHVSMGRSIGMGVQYPGFYETLALQSPHRHYQECQTELEARYGIIPPQRSWFAQLYRQTQEGLRSAADTARTETA